MKVCLLLIDYGVSNHVIKTNKKTGDNWIKNLVAVKSEGRDKMIYFSQYDKKWKNFPYSSKNHPKATIETAGCGITAAAIIIANLANKLINPLLMAKFSLENGYRGLEGTTEGLFPAIAKKYDLIFEQSNDIKDLMNALKNGKLVVCLMNDWFRPGMGHYIVAYKTIGGLIKIKDPASTINNAKLYSQSTFKTKGAQYFIYNAKPKKDEYIEAIVELDKLDILDRQYWANKRKIDKYFPELIKNFAKYAKVKEKKK